MAGLGAALLCFAAVALDLRGGGLLLLAVWVAAFLAWLLGSAAALTGAGQAARAVAFMGLGGGLVLSLLGGGAVDRVPAPGLGAALAGWPFERLLLLAGVGLVMLSTANVAVRLVLDAVGVPASTNEKQLKGGRMLGPMERLFIVGLGLAGQLTAAAVVVAAKGLLRFPELQRGSEAGGPSDVTEYFLIGSFASWLVALAGLGLLAL
jgi:hypothetical protein